MLATKMRKLKAKLGAIEKQNDHNASITVRKQKANRAAVEETHHYASITIRKQKQSG